MDNDHIMTHIGQWNPSHSKLRLAPLSKFPTSSHLLYCKRVLFWLASECLSTFIAQGNNTCFTKKNNQSVQLPILATYFPNCAPVVYINPHLLLVAISQPAFTQYMSSANQYQACGWEIPAKWLSKLKQHQAK